MNTRKTFCIFILAMGTTMVGSPAHAQQKGQPGSVLPQFWCDGDANPNARDVDSRILSDLVDVRECWPAELSTGSHYYLNDFYTRWVVEEVANAPPGMARYYSGERRSAFERFFLGRTRNTAVSVKIKMRDPDVDFTIPLMSVDYSGKRGEGQSFTTLLTRSDMSLPDFRISPTTSVSVETTAHASKEVDFHGAGTVLSTLRDALSIASPGSTLLTSVNKDQVQRLSTAYDATLSKLLSSSLTESVTSGRMLSQWQSGHSFLVTVHVPPDIRTKDDRTPPIVERTITFRISMTCPRLSIFDSLNLCEITDGAAARPLIGSTFPAARATDPISPEGWPGTGSDRYILAVSRLRQRISPHQVLSFRLSEGKTLRQFLTEQEWFISLSKGLVTAGGQTNAQAAQAADRRAPDPPPNPAAIASQEAAAGKPADAPSTGNGPAKGGASDVKDKTEQANQLCESITDKLYSTGLSHLDANIGLWATITGMPDFTNAKGVFQNAPACREHMPAGPAKGAWRFEEAPVPDDAPPPPPAPKKKKKAAPARRA